MQHTFDKGGETMKREILSAVIAGGVLVTGTLLPSLARADLSANIGVANMYLWRGQNLTKSGAQVQGGIKFSHATGLYAGAWTTTETDGHETDLYFGYGGAIQQFKYDVSYWHYLYPEDRSAGLQVDLGKNDVADAVLSGGYGPITVTGYIQMEAPDGTASNQDENNYFTISAMFDKFMLTYGMWALETSTSGDEYTHLTAMYSATPELSLGVSFVQSDLDTKTNAGAVEEDPLFYVAYNWNFDLAKK
jgi:uncharacterized protein (TIGR02001 family)